MRGRRWPQSPPCGVPSERGDQGTWLTQGLALGLYTQFLWGRGTGIDEVMGVGTPTNPRLPTRSCGVTYARVIQEDGGKALVLRLGEAVEDRRAACAAARDGSQVSGRALVQGRHVDKLKTARQTSRVYRAKIALPLNSAASHPAGIEELRGDFVGSVAAGEGEGGLVAAQDLAGAAGEGCRFSWSRIVFP